MKTFLLTVALFAAVVCAAPKNKRDVSHLLKDGEYLPPHHHEHHHHHHHDEESAPQPGYHYSVPHPSFKNQYHAPQPSVNNQYLAPQPFLNNQYLAPQPSLNNQYLAPVAKASEPENLDIHFPATSYGVPFRAAPAPAPVEVAAHAEDHLTFDELVLGPEPESVGSAGRISNGHEYAQQQVDSNGGYVY